MTSPGSRTRWLALYAPCTGMLMIVLERIILPVNIQGDSAEPLCLRGSRHDEPPSAVDPTKDQQTGGFKVPCTHWGWVP